MKQGYDNPLVTYDEIIEAIQSILECSISSNYLDNYDYLNVKYSSPSRMIKIIRYRFPLYQIIHKKSIQHIKK